MCSALQSRIANIVAKATGNETTSTTESAIRDTTAFNGAVNANANLNKSKEGASKESEKSPDIICVDDNIISSSSNGSQSNQIAPTPKDLVPCLFLRRRGRV